MGSPALTLVVAGAGVTDFESELALQLTIKSSKLDRITVSGLLNIIIYLIKKRVDFT